MSRQERILKILEQHYTQSHVSVLNESMHHHVPKNSETHFKIEIISEAFENMSRLQRHQMINQLLQEEFKSGMHALSLHLYTAEEWQKRNKKSLPSPSCKDGYQH